MTSNNDLSGLTREELLRMVVAQQSQLHSEQGRQAAFARLMQRPGRNYPASTPFVQDRWLASSDTRTFRDVSASAELNSGAYDSFLSAPNRSHFSNAEMSDLVMRRALLARIGSTTTPASADSVSTADLLQARARLEIENASTMRQLMLHRGLFGTSGTAGALPRATYGNAAFASDLHAVTSSRASDFPSEGSTEDVLLRRLVAGNGESQATNGALAAVQATTFFDPSQRPMELATKHLLSMASPLSAFRSGHIEKVGSSSGVGSETDDTKPAAAAVGDSKSVAAKKKTKRPLSAYNIFFKEEHAKIIDQNEKEKAEKRARGEPIACSDDEYCDEDDDNAAVDVTKTKGNKRKRSLSTNQPGKRGKRQVDFENLTKVIGKRWKELPSERVEEYKRRAEEAMREYRKNLFQKIRNSVKEDHS